MLKVGITGGIGSGKSLICKVFSLLGIDVYNSDERAKYLMGSNVNIKEALISRFGQNVYMHDELNRPYLANIIFNDKNALDFVNNTVHPIVGEDYLNWFVNQKEKAYCLKEAALLFESGMYKDLDCLITITSPEELRIKRVMQRDKISHDKVMERIKNQWSDEQKIKLSNFVILNNEIESVIEQVLNIHENLITQK
jgi:dephospho-CoA kinase